jgi:replication factor C large subunit
MLSEKHRPKTLASLIGNEDSRLALSKWLKNWKVGAKPALLTGPPGVGKSTSVYAVAREQGYSVLELNASDARTRDRLREAIGPLLENSRMFGEKMLVFLDEIDGLSGRSDYAGMDYVLKFMEEATMPVVMAANWEDTQKLRKIEQKSLLLRFKPIEPRLIFVYLKSITRREDIEVKDDVLLKIAENSRGDVRQALNSLQTLAGSSITGSVTDHQFMSDLSALDSVLKAETLQSALPLFRQYDVSPYEKIRNIFDAVAAARNLSIESRAESLELIARADILLRRINAEQSWRLLRYLDRYLGLATAGKKLKRVDSSIPWNLKLAIWNDKKVISGIEEKLFEVYHAGASDLASFYLPYFVAMFRSRPELFEEFIVRNGFGDSERRVLVKLNVRK